MAIIRFSAERDRLFAPRDDGTFVDAPYAGGVGLIGAFATDGGCTPETAALLRQHLEEMVPDAAQQADFVDPGSPLVVMVHGFQFVPRAETPDPAAASDNPHDTVFSFSEFTRREQEKWHATGWPLELGIPKSAGSTSGGIAVAFGWDSGPSRGLVGDNYRRAYERAAASAGPLLAVMRTLTEVVGAKSVDVLCHSLGSRPVLRSLLCLANADSATLGKVGRIIMLGGAELVDRAAEACDAVEATLEAGIGPRIYNVGNSYDQVLGIRQTFIPPSRNSVGRTGRDKFAKSARWIDLDIGYESVRDWMDERFGLEVENTMGRDNHWFYFTDTANFAVYRAILHREEGWEIDELRASDPPIPKGLGHGESEA